MIGEAGLLLDQVLTKTSLLEAFVDFWMESNGHDKSAGELTLDEIQAIRQEVSRRSVAITGRREEPHGA